MNVQKEELYKAKNKRFKILNEISQILINHPL